MSTAGSGGLEVGAGQAAAAIPDSVPSSVAEQIQAAAQQAFATAFTDAMRPTMVVPLVVVVLAAIAVLFVRNRPLSADRVSEPSRDPEPAST